MAADFAKKHLGRKAGQVFLDTERARELGLIIDVADGYFVSPGATLDLLHPPPPDKLTCRDPLTVF